MKLRANAKILKDGFMYFATCVWRNKVGYINIYKAINVISRMIYWKIGVYY